MMEGRRLPYPGLRAYARDETDLFFGREGSVNEMIDRLAATRFLAVLGTSGSGKSSLVRTGLLDALELGLYAAAGSRWTIVECHPGENPLRNLALALLTAARGGEPGETEVDLLEAFLGRGPLAIVEWLADGNLPQDQNILLLVDQFEELFRYSNYAGREQAEAFAALLLESTRNNPRIHVTITMRSEYLGACALIPGLAEQINDGLYLARRMTRDECRQAIEGPAGVMGFAIEPALVTRLLNDLAGFAPWEADRESSQLQRLSRQADQLPLMQHVLSRLWQLAARRDGAERLVLRLQDYVDIGELQGAIEQHAAEVIAGLKESSRPYVRHVFRALVTGSSLADAVRRPRSFAELVAVTGARPEQVLEILDAFRSPDTNFLRPPLDQEIRDGSLIDISHESLIRQWRSLSAWFAEESEFGARWLRLVEAEDRHAKGQESLLGGLTLANLADWWDREKPNAAWAAGHGGRYDRVSAFLEESRRAEEAAAERERVRAEKQRTSLRRRSAIYFVLAVFSAATAVYGFYQARQALAAKADADGARVAAERAALEAEKAKLEAEEQRAIAEQNAEDAQEAQTRAEQQEQAALDAARQAEEQKRIANTNQSRALASLSQLELSQTRSADSLKLALASWPRAGDMEGPQLVSSTEALSLALPDFRAKVMFPRADYGLYTAALSPDGKRLALALWDNTVRIWDAESGRELRVLAGHTTPVTDIVFSDDGKHIVTVAGYHMSVYYQDDYTPRLWDIETGTSVELSGHTNAVTAVDRSPDGKLLATSAMDGTLRLWDMATGAPLLSLSDTDAVMSVKFSADGRYLAAGNWPGVGKVWKIDAAAPRADLVATTTALSEPIRWLAISPDGTTLALAGSYGYRVAVWDIPSDTVVTNFTANGVVNAGSFSPDAKLLALATTSGLSVYDTENWADTGKFQTDAYYYGGDKVEFSPDGARLLASSGSTTTIWNVAAGTPAAKLDSYGTVTAARFAVDGRLALTASTDGTARLWDGTLGTAIGLFEPAEALIAIPGDDQPELRAFVPATVAYLTMHSGEVSSVAMSADGRTAFTASPADGRIGRVDLSSGAAMADAWVSGETLATIALSPGGTHAALVARNSRMSLLDVATGTTRPLDTGQVRPVDLGSNFSPRFSADGRFLAGRKNIGEFRLWDAKTGDVIADVPGPVKNVVSVGVSRDGGRLVVAAASPSRLLVWDFAARAWVNDIRVQTLAPTFAEFSPDGNFVLLATRQDGVEVWDLRTSNRVQTVGTRYQDYEVGTGSGYFNVAYSPSGDRFVAGTDGLASLHDGATWARLSNAGRALTRDGILRSAAFSEDSKHLALGYSDGTLQIVDISRLEQGDAFAVACERLGPDTALADIQARYRLGELLPICGASPPIAVDPARLQ
ncbi:MAG: hypothetical protein KF723_20690 [Rhizobiaceae bacterium]|nr:hypothetical protein [Rhizobiaceae bacterium]